MSGASSPSAAPPSHAAISTGEPLLSVSGLRVTYPSARGGGSVIAVDDVSFAIEAGRTLGLVGESGCGKSTLARAIVGLASADAGRIRFDGRTIAAGDAIPRAWRRGIGVVFQDPYASLNPRHSIEAIVGEGLLVHGIGAPADRRDAVVDVLRGVGLSANYLRRYPHELSGGQRQRVAIARALAPSPRLLILDEPVSALDVSVQSQVLNLLVDLQARLGLAYLFIGHHLGAVRFISRDIAVMHAGRIVEHGTADEVTQRPQHPYTQRLLSAVVEVTPRPT